MSFPLFALQLLNGIEYGLLLFLVASGLTLIFGVLGVLNFAHGSFYMLGAYLAYWVGERTGSLGMAIAVGVPLMFAAGWVVERLAFIVVALATDKTGVTPRLDRAGGHAEPAGHLVQGEHAGVAEPLLSAA